MTIIPMSASPEKVLATLAAIGIAYAVLRRLEPKQMNEDLAFTAQGLIDAFGDQAYHKGCAMTIEALRAADQASSRALAKANIELIKMGYHKKPRTENKETKTYGSSI